MEVKEIRVLVAIASYSMLLMVLYSLLPPVFPLYAERVLHPRLDDAQVSFIFSIFAVAQLIASVFFGFLTPRVGARRVLYIGAGVECVSSMIFGLCSDFGCFVSFRLIMGVGSGMCYTATLTLMAEYLPTILGMSNGINELAGALGAVIGPVVGGALYSKGCGSENPNCFWLPFMAVGGVAFVVLVPLLPMMLPVDAVVNPIKRLFRPSDSHKHETKELLKEKDKDSSREESDGEAFELGESQAERADVGIVEDVRGAWDQAKDFLKIALHPSVIVSLISVLAASSLLNLFLPSLGPHLADRYHIAPLRISLLFLIGAVSFTITAPLVGILSDKYLQKKACIVFGLLAAGAGYLFLGPIPGLLDADKYPTAFAYVAVCIWFGIGMGSALIPAFPDLLGSVRFAKGMSAEPENGKFEDMDFITGPVSGAYTAMYSLGEIIAPLLGSGLKEATGSIEWAYSVFGFILIGIAIFFVLPASIYEAIQSRKAVGAVPMRQPDSA